MDGKHESDSDCTTETKNLTNEEREKLERQNSRMISDFVANKLDSESKKHWDLFYKRNETRFFKDRHWTTREFKELVGKDVNEKCVLLEVGCGVGNFVYPLFEENANFFIYACDISGKAIDLLKQNKSYCENKIKAFQTDITTENILSEIPRSSVDMITLIFVLSAIDPSKYSKVATTLFSLLKPGGYILFRDYGLYDMTQLRFKPGHKISENFYMRQDGTRYFAENTISLHSKLINRKGPVKSYFFSVEFLGDLFQNAGFMVISNCYVHRRTINVKEGIDVPRIFVQAKFIKPV